MSFLDALFGRSKPKQPDLDALFALPSAAVTLEAEAGLRPSGQAGVCFKPASGAAFASLAQELGELLRLGGRGSGTAVAERGDRYGYRWLVLSDPDLDDLVTGVHLVNTALAERGFGPQLLCSLFGFTGGQGAPVLLVYLYKRGTFYPFAPRPGERRDSEAELRVRALVAGELPIEEDLGRWFPLWDAPLRGGGP